MRHVGVPDASLEYYVSPAILVWTLAGVFSSPGLPVTPRNERQGAAHLQAGHSGIRDKTLCALGTPCMCPITQGRPWLPILILSKACTSYLRWQA